MKALALLLAATYEIIVSTTIGEPKLTVFGYTSPQARVQLQGNRVFEEVTADYQGYFFFDRVFLPRPSPSSDGKTPEIKYPELCLTSIDTQSQISFPTCLPPLPTGPFEITVGPVLLPPTISLQKGSFLAGQQVTAQGLTIPNAEVTIFLANNLETPRMVTRQRPRLLRGEIVRTAHAHFLPNYQIQADKDGRFEFNLPSVRPALRVGGPAGWRIFASATFLDAPTPKSNTLIFKVLNWWEWWWHQLAAVLKQLFSLFKPHWWVLIIIAEVFIIILFISRQRRSTKADSNSLRQGSISHPRLNEKIANN